MKPVKDKLIVDSGSKSRGSGRVENSIGLEYNIALGLNTFGVKHVMNFAKQCTKLKAVLHVSTGSSMEAIVATLCPLKIVLDRIVLTSTGVLLGCW
ncbi:hypothetical protein JHK85_010524 [Glycine max]|nr:hypothetical protein JHK85_010524 [Glycine max]